MGYIEALKQTIRRLHGCDSEHIGTVPVTEPFPGDTVLEEDVEVFSLRGHSKTNRCYAWARETDNGKQLVAILKIPPVDSPAMAVCAAITDESKGNRRKAKLKNP
jgi:hypothetical protein